MQKLEHELLPKVELVDLLLPFRPELEGVDDAHVQQPPRQARPAAHGLPAWGIGVVKLREHIDRASPVKVVANRFRAAD